MIVAMAGCSSPVDTARSILPWWGGGGTQGEQEPLGVMEKARNTSVRIGSILLIGGIILTVLTKGASGWGLSIAASGLICILMAWLFDQWWAPWVGAVSIFAYVAYKVWNRLDPEQETEPLLE